MRNDGEEGGGDGTPFGTPPGTPPVVPSMTSSTVQIGGIVIEIYDSQVNVGDDEELLYKKEDREHMSPEKLAQLFEKANKNRYKKFDFINLTLSDEDKLDDTYSLDMLVRKMKNTHINCDMHNVDLVRRTLIGSNNLYTKFSEISVVKVAHSNEFYLRWAKVFYYAQNLKLTYVYFQSNVSEELWEKTFETHDEYDSKYKGGPLFFIIMINKLLSNTEEAAATL